MVILPALEAQMRMHPLSRRGFSIIMAAIFRGGIIA